MKKVLVIMILCSMTLLTSCSKKQSEEQAETLTVTATPTPSPEPGKFLPGSGKMGGSVKKEYVLTADFINACPDREYDDILSFDPDNKEELDAMFLGFKNVWTENGGEGDIDKLKISSFPIKQFNLEYDKNTDQDVHYEEVQYYVLDENSVPVARLSCFTDGKEKNTSFAAGVFEENKTEKILRLIKENPDKEYAWLVAGSWQWIIDEDDNIEIVEEMNDGTTIEVSEGCFVALKERGYSFSYNDIVNS